MIESSSIWNFRDFILYLHVHNIKKIFILIARSPKTWFLQFVCRSAIGYVSRRQSVGRLVCRSLLQETRLATGWFVLETLKRSPLEVEDPPSDTYDEVLPAPRLWRLWSSARWTRRQLLAEKHATHSIIRAADFHVEIGLDRERENVRRRRNRGSERKHRDECPR